MKIEEISARTKIKVSLLQAIERGEFEQLPGEFFTRAFLRTYARELRLPPDEIVRDYDAAHAPAEPLPDTSGGLRPPVNGLFSESRWPAGRSLWPLATLAGVLIVVLSAMTRSEPVEGPEPGAIGTVGVAEAPEAVSAIAKAPAAPETLRLEIRPSALIWVTATADGKRVIYRLLQPGEPVTVEARNEVSFRVGDAGAFAYSINGTPAKAPGAPGEVREFQITRDNYRAFQR